MFNRIFYATGNEREQGAVAVVVAVCLFMFFAFAALAVDTGHLYGVRNELQNAADAGALAGALNLLDPDTGDINPGANQEATDVATANTTGTVNVTELTVQRGHWSFGLDGSPRTFTPNNSLTQVEWHGRSFTDMDADTNFINAVRVQTRRSDTPSFLARIFNYDQFFVATDAVAYIGPAGSVIEGTVDIPFAICKEFITGDDGELLCGEARSQHEGVETGGWTNFSQDREDPYEECESSNASDVNKNILEGLEGQSTCEGINDVPLNKDMAIGSINGAVSSTWAMIVEHCFVDAPSNPDCFRNDVKYNAKKPWFDVKFPVVNCIDGNYAGGGCDDTKVSYETVITVDVIWMSKVKDNVPVEYDYDINRDGIEDPGEHFACTDPSINLDDCANPAPEQPELCWEEFQTFLGEVLKTPTKFVDPNNDGLPEGETIYFAPSCKYVESMGQGDGEIYDVLAKYPKLVE